MQRFHSVLVLLIALVLSACSDDTITPDTDDSGNGGGKGFSIVAVDRDTVLWEDTVTVTLRNATTDSFSVFIHTVPVVIDSAWRDSLGNAGLRFRVPSDASTGSIRVYERTTVQASGTHTLVIVPRKRSTVEPFIYTSTQFEGYEGDLLHFYCQDLQFAAKDMHVYVGEHELPIHGWDSVNLLVRVTPEVKSGPITITLLGRLFDCGTFTKLEHTQAQLSGKSAIMFQMYQSFCSGTSKILNVEDSTSSTIPTLEVLSFGLSFNPAQIKQEGDSLILLVGPENFLENLELRLKFEADNRVSGIARVKEDLHYQWREAECELRNMRWKRIGDEYRIYALGSDITSEMPRYSHRIIRDGKIEESVSYTGGEVSSWFEIRLRVQD